jgi:aldose sugar dehydrogenase
LLLLLPTLKSHVPFWAADNPEESGRILALAFIAGMLLLSIAAAAGARVGGMRAVGVMFAAFCLAFLFLLLHKPAPAGSRSVVAALFAIGMVFSAMGFTLRGIRAPLLGALLLLLAALIGLELFRAYHPAPLHLEVEKTTISTGFYTLQDEAYRNAVPATDVRGGGLSMLGEDYLLTTGDGRMYRFNWSKSGAFAIRDLHYRVPVNIAEFSEDANPTGYAGKPNGGDQADRLQGVQTWQFRVADVHVQDLGGKVRIFASHHFWKRDQQCFVVRLSSLTGTREMILSGDDSLKWETVWESKPCLSLHGEDSVHENNPFSGMEVGGRIGMVDAATVLLTLGDHDYTGVESKRMFSQEPDVSYGKTILIHLNDGSSEVFTLGHRNPQGLYITPQGDIWSTEHGPQGGDELNRLVRGANYGWPLVTYGTDYGSPAWPLNKTPGRHDGYQEPAYVWIPSIGVSNLIGIEKDRMPAWKGDLLVSSLHAHSLFRLRLLDQRVVFAEPIAVGERVRDLIEGADGRLVLWTDSSSIVSLTPVAGTGGEVLFANNCGACHKAIDGATHAYGPDLAGVVGRTVASAEGFNSYSAALKGLHGKWDRARLDQFLESPQSFAPGTAMTFRGVEDAEQRKAIIDYLATTRHY